MMKKIFTVCLIFSISQFAVALDITHLATQKTVSLGQLLKGDLEGKTLVFGEQHYDKAILKAHATLIWELIRREKLEKNFTVGWEFLEYDHAQAINIAFNDWKNSKITDEEYLKGIFPNSKKPLQNLPYLNFMAATAKLGGKLIATNATRETKKELMENGVGILYGKDLPDHMLAGSSNYLKRFTDIMGGHVPADQVQKYFLAQYYTDNIIGTYLERHSNTKVSFLVIGSFHSDYNDGVVRYLHNYSQQKVVSFKIVNKSTLSSDELKDLYQKDPTYGYIADYLVVTE